MNKVAVLLVVCLIVVGGIVYFSNDIIEEEKEDMEKEYQGPVPEGYNVEHFRKTGETIKEVEK